MLQTKVAFDEFQQVFTRITKGKICLEVTFSLYKLAIYVNCNNVRHLKHEKLIIISFNNNLVEKL